ncbi:FecR family protein [uncultured Proteiniphilum sp.]|uniref:FecR family protein n=1 Tax=uncultured Proteiniphilum sp. TaxID=497637 RepID=UPI00262A1E19|nr:FecR family protein [uncultured Proteiniphilum sp.]
MEKNRQDRDESVRFVVQHYQKGMFEPSKGWKRLTASLPGSGRVRYLSFITRAAAAVVLLFVAGIGVWMMVNRPEQLFAQVDNTEFTLPDNSQIVMQRGAKLEYDRHFGKTERHVSMQGEIAFAVVRDETRPFIISTPTARIEVLGTEFTVNAGDNETRLSVTSGKVRFTPDDPVIPLLCTAGMTVHYSANTETINVSSPGSEMEINGKTRSLTFDNIGLKEIVMVLSHFYNVQIELPENESDLTFSSSFTGKSIVEIINIINFTLDTNIVIVEHGGQQ